MTAKISSKPLPVAAMLNRHDSSLGIWFDTVDKNADTAFRITKAVLNRHGFKLGDDPRVKRHYPSLNKTHRLGKLGDLEVEVSLSGRAIEVQFFQNVYQVENANGGRYDFDKLTKMPYLMAKRVELMRNRIETALSAKFAISHRVHSPQYTYAEGLTNLQAINLRNRASGHYREELGRPDWHGEYNRKSADGELLEQGSEVYFTDIKGRWLQGRAYYNLNSMWWVASGRYGLTNKSSHELHLQRPEVLRKKDNRGYSLRRIESLIAKAVGKQDFLRAHALKVVQNQRRSVTTPTA